MNGTNTGHPCPTCGGADTVAVWEDPEAWTRGEDPDYIGCHDCNIMIE